MNILLTSAGRRSYIVDYFKNTTGIDKVYASNSVYTIALERADGYYISPIIYDPSYIPSIIQYCKENSITAVLSLFDIDLLVLAENAKTFNENGIELVLAPAEFVRICNDKYLTYEFVKSLGLDSPYTFKKKEDAKRAIAEGLLSYPIIIKPRWGMASMGIYVVDDEEELEFFSKKCSKIINNTYLKFESSMTKDEEVLYQEYIDGKEYGLDVLNDLKGKYIKTFAKQKITMRSGETDLGMTTDSYPFVEAAKLISSKSGHHGICSVDCLVNDEGKVYIIEMNCRISGHFPLAYLAGFNYPQLLSDWLNNKGTNENLLQFKTGLFIVKDLKPTILAKDGYGKMGLKE